MPPLLFVHGAWHGAWCWEEHFLRYFGDRGWSVKAIDLRGHGSAPGRKRLRWTRIAEYVEDVAKAADALPEPPVVIGHSMGGLVVQKYLESHTAAGAVLLASVPPAGVLLTTLRFLNRHPVQFLKTNLLLSLWPIVETPELAREMFFSSTMRESEVRALHERLQDESYLAYLDMMLFALPQPAAVAKLPMLVLGGREDRVFSPREVERTAKAYGADLEIFPDLAHDLMLGPGWQVVAVYLDSWLRRNLLGGLHVDEALPARLPVGPAVDQVAEDQGPGGGEHQPSQDLAVGEGGEHLVDAAVEDGPASQLKPVDKRRKRGEKGKRTRKDGDRKDRAREDVENLGHDLPVAVGIAPSEEDHAEGDGEGHHRDEGQQAGDPQ
jgi:pimeloyl-ACP methyl ester carboxylesterase